LTTIFDPLQRKITFSNLLARGDQGLSLIQKRAVTLALAHVNVLQEDLAGIAAAGGLSAYVRASEYAQAFSVSLSAAYRALKEVADGLPSAVIDLDAGPISWVALAEYHRKGLALTLTPGVCAHLVGLTREFISYPLSTVVPLRSLYAWRLLECLESWRIKKEWEIGLTEFCSMMGAPLGYASDFGRIRNRILDPAVSELASQYQQLTWAPIKLGRTVVKLRFEFNKLYKFKRKVGRNVPRRSGGLAV
jgi:plasmid replication initiation protein